MSIKSRILLIGLIFVAVWVPQYIGTFNARNASVNACERSNEGLRTPLYEFMKGAEKSRREQARITTGMESRVNKATANEYKDIAEAMVLAVSEELRLEADRPEVDCEAAYPKPFPFNIG